MKFGDNLKKLRKDKKLSQEELASSVNVSRQSVSKWETGESYPEMNNILELCKVLNCNINDLVNDNIIDLDSLDKEIVKLKKDDQKKIKGLSKTIAIIARIGRIVTMVAIPAILIIIILIPNLINNVTIEDNKLIFTGGDKPITLIEEKTNKEDNVKVKYKNTLIAEESDINTIDKIKEVFDNNSKQSIIWYAESSFIILIINLLLLAIFLNKLEKLFTNIHSGNTPFTLENIKSIKKMAYIMIAIILIPSLGGSIFEGILKMDLDIDLDIFDLIQVLFLFSLSYIFQYGYEIQSDSKGKMYDE